jgi:endonuclease YncB( thermonuclease family)
MNPIRNILVVSLFLALLSSSLHAQQSTTATRIVDGDTLKVRYWGKDEGKDENKQ